LALPAPGIRAHETVMRHVTIPLFTEIIRQTIATRFGLIVAKETVEYDEIIDLRDASDEIIMLSQETLEFSARSVDRQLRWMKR